MIALFLSFWQQKQDLNSGPSASDFLLICFQDLSSSFINTTLQLQRAFNFLNVKAKKLFFCSTTEEEEDTDSE